MDHLRAVRFGQSLGELARIGEEPLGDERSGFEDLAKRLALDIFHGDEVDALVSSDVVDVHNVGMVERGCRARFLLESPHTGRRRARWEAS